jgi:hypothetical protein
VKPTRKKTESTAPDLQGSGIQANRQRTPDRQGGIVLKARLGRRRTVNDSLFGYMLFPIEVYCRFANKSRSIPGLGWKK